MKSYARSRRGVPAFAAARLPIVFAPVLVLGLLAAPPADAGAPTDALRNAFAQVNRVLAEPSMQGEPAKQMAACRALFGSVFDFRAAAQYSLGREWQARTPREQEDFTDLFGDLIEFSYVRWLALTADVDSKAGLRVRYVDEATDRDTALVQTAIASRRGLEVPVSYDMVYGSGRWMIRDVHLDAISILANYRAQFGRMIRDFSYAGLLTRMKALHAGETQSAATDPAAPGAIKIGVATRLSRSPDGWDFEAP
jgi:phospholipid transport system substrate-binding protein